MLTNTPINDIISGSDREADFLLPEIEAHSRLRKTYRLSIANRIAPFLLEDRMRDSKGRFVKGHKLGFQKGHIPWCKGTKGLVKIPFSSFQKGHIPWNKGKKLGFVPKCAFKKGHISWLKGTKGLITSWCKGKPNPYIQREKNPRWKGGIKKVNGYIHLLKPEHPFCDKQGYVRRSRLIMEQHIGRYLKPKEVVHHINSIVDDDRIENLMLFPNHSKHQKHHHPKGYKFSRKKKGG